MITFYQFLLENLDTNRDFEALDSLRTYVQQTYPGVDLSAHEHKQSGWDTNTIHLGMIKVPVDEQKNGIGTKAMTLLCRYADKHDEVITLTLSDERRGNGNPGRTKLIDWYKGFGFVLNAGRNKDFTLNGMSGGMYRVPNRKKLLDYHREHAAPNRRP